MGLLHCRQILCHLSHQATHPYMTTGKTIALTIKTFVGKVMSLLFNMLSRFVIAFLLRSKCFFISRLQSASGVIPFSLGWNWGKEVIFPYSCEILKSWLWCRINAQGSGSQWCSNQWHQPHLGNCEKCRFLGSTPDLLSLTLQCLFERAPKGSWCGHIWRTTVLTAWVQLLLQKTPEIYF